MTCYCETPEILPTDYAVDVCENCGEVVPFSEDEY
jgi:hypothetical protein